MAFNAIHPRGVCRCENPLRIVPVEPFIHLCCEVRGEVIHNEIEANLSRILFPDPGEQLEELPSAFSSFDKPIHDVSMHIIGSKKVLDAMFPGICRGYAVRATDGCPIVAWARSDFKRPELVHADDLAVVGRLLVELLYSFFLGSSCGSLDSFQVLVR